MPSNGSMSLTREPQPWLPRDMARAISRILANLYMARLKSAGLPQGEPGERRHCPVDMTTAVMVRQRPSCTGNQINASLLNMQELLTWMKTKYFPGPPSMDN